MCLCCGFLRGVNQCLHDYSIRSVWIDDSIIFSTSELPEIRFNTIKFSIFFTLFVWGLSKSTKNSYLPFIENTQTTKSAIRQIVITTTKQNFCLLRRYSMANSMLNKDNKTKTDHCSTSTLHFSFTLYWLHSENVICN